ncbi:hypothetical protein CSC62_07575 [Pseudoxanthomonas jiangsuensis]|uniref:baseplate hub domain-containing protein n=1 Tax=Pseudoxanthomonas jiangsuensis TaxID=619688 RepID=UPI001390CAC8|nr:DUF2163 domain-containing protein [Pseudoxanthomonas jiangsuensis]KAF1697996.1 hypothetical protein CSC62_07575 [Pseudoxanthomonas jiangsuensis]
MGFNLRELSRFLGRPVQLFAFTRQNRVWRFTTADRDVTVGEHVYLSAPGISRTAIRESGERAKNNVTIKLPFLTDPGAIELPPTQDLGRNWLPYPPSDPVYVDCMTYHADDPDAEVIIDWTGKVLQPKCNGTLLELVCSPSRAAKGAWVGGAPRIQRACDRPVYSQGIGQCNLDPDAWEVEATVTDVDGLTLTAAEFERDDGIEWPGGFVQWERADGIVETRTIRAASGLTLTLDYGAADLGEVTSLKAWPGCPHNWAGCTARDNNKNYGGCLCMPGKSAFDGTRAV